MEMKDAFAGTLESGDILIQISPTEKQGVEIELQSSVAYQFGEQIKKVIVIGYRKFKIKQQCQIEVVLNMI